jgi:hypothetical protein
MLQANGIPYGIAFAIPTGLTDVGFAGAEPQREKPS